jgi:hypothetical protein
MTGKAIVRVGEMVNTLDWAKVCAVVDGDVTLDLWVVTEIPIDLMPPPLPQTRSNSNQLNLEAEQLQVEIQTFEMFR